MKRKLEGSQDEMVELETEHKAKISQLDTQIHDKESTNVQIKGELTIEKMQSQKLEEQRSDLLKKYEEEKASWLDLKQKIEQQLSKQQGLLRERVPFDPFSNQQTNILNGIKSDCKTREKQVEIVQTIKSLVDPTSTQSLAQGFESLFAALKNLSDGSMPVFNNEFENDDCGGALGNDSAYQNNLVNPSIK